MKEKISAIFNRVIGFYSNKPIVFCVVLAFVINFLIELLSRHSLWKAVVHMVQNPVAFIFNVAIIFFTLTIGFLFKRRNFIMLILSVLWISLGILNCILLFFRTTPLSLVDFMIAKSALTMLPVYLNVLEIILIALWVMGIIAGGIIAWMKLPKIAVHIKQSAVLVIATAVVVSSSSMVSASVAAKNGSFAILTKAYEDLGFVYCFSCGVFDKGITKPENYNQTQVENILKEYTSEADLDEQKPNIIIVQLESFFDVSYLKNCTFSKDPSPNFNMFKEECSSGLLTVPSMGGGTANTEFEVLTGMSLDYFGMGEYPYQTILKQEPCESLPYILNEKGYKSTAIHNHTGTFYNRNIVYSNLGFDKFAPVETINLKEKNELGWAKDEILVDTILSALHSTQERDFIFTVTMQGHGKYPTEEIEYNKLIEIDDFNIEEDSNEELKNGIEYYVNQIKETDDVVGYLIEALKNYPEPVYVVMYGDHLPALEITEDDLKTRDIYQTEYFIWNNYEENKNIKKDINAYELSTVLLDSIGMKGNLVNEIHKRADKKESEEILHILSYDMLYGEKYSLDNPYLPTDLQIGIEEAVIKDVERDGINPQNTYVRGKNFTPYSRVCINKDRIDTTFVDEQTLAIATEDLEKGCLVSVEQVTKESVAIFETEPYQMK